LIAPFRLKKADCPAKGDRRECSSGWRFFLTDEDRSMPPFIAFAGVLGGLAAVRWAYKTAQRINRELEEMRLSRMADAVGTAEIPTLRRDPVTGAYRPG
jgi:hypothetical protein